MTARAAGILILVFGAEVAAAQGVGRTTGAATGQLTLARAEALIRETSLTVEQLRRLRFKRPVAVEVVDPATARKHFEEDIDDEDRERARHIRDAWVQIGLIAPETDLVEARLDQAEKDVAGYYKSGSDTFRLLSHVSESEVRAVMAHELTHALEDQHYDLLAVQKRATNADQAVAIRSVIEGSAMVTTAAAWRSTCTHASLADASTSIACSCGATSIASSDTRNVPSSHDQMRSRAYPPRAVRTTKVSSFGVTACVVGSGKSEVWIERARSRSRCRADCCASVSSHRQ